MCSSKSTVSYFDRTSFCWSSLIVVLVVVLGPVLVAAVVTLLQKDFRWIVTSEFCFVRSHNRSYLWWQQRSNKVVRFIDCNGRHFDTPVYAWFNRKRSDTWRYWWCDGVTWYNMVLRPSWCGGTTNIVLPHTRSQRRHNTTLPSATADAYCRFTDTNNEFHHMFILFVQNDVTWQYRCSFDEILDFGWGSDFLAVHIYDHRSSECVKLIIKNWIKLEVTHFYSSYSLLTALLRVLIIAAVHYVLAVPVVGCVR